jgi:hypothetical protein
VGQAIDRKHDDLPARTPLGSEGMLSQFIKVEANLLRLPLFALHTKGLRTLDAIECRGRLSRDDTAHEFSFRAFRSTATHYPGPLSRSAHLAFLSLLTERGLPLQNPITWTWRDLCRRMRISCSGRTVERLKAAVSATAGLYILSTHALYSKPAGKRICTREEGLHLYDRVCFLGAELPEGRVADTNYLWISDWYLANLNALFTAPLNYDLWRSLEDRSAIASRLYEFLLLNFYNGAPTLRINYANLVQFLPVKSEPHPSQAKQQLGPALNLLRALEVIEVALWSESRDGQVQLVFHRGRHLVPPRDQDRVDAPLVFEDDDFSSTVEVEELRTLKPPQWTIVVDFYRLWSGRENHRPTKKELEQAGALIDQYGVSKLKALIALAIKRMKVKWPDAKAFGSVIKYLAEAAEEYERDQRRLEHERQEVLGRQQERDEAERQNAHQAQFEATWRPAWEALAEAQREEIRRSITSKNPFLTRAPKMLESFCLEELARRSENLRPESSDPAHETEGGNRGPRP